VGNNPQTDLLSHKTTMSSRMDGLEAATTRRLDELGRTVSALGEGARGLEASLGEKADLLQKKVALPLHGVIAVAALQLLTLAALFLR
jgi:hypothetical protein